VETRSVLFRRNAEGSGGMRQKSSERGIAVMTAGPR
jgi:hypothetical protein